VFIFEPTNKECKMVEKLLKMKINETIQIEKDEYDVMLTTKSRLKKSGKGEWSSNNSFMGIYVKRTK